MINYALEGTFRTHRAFLEEATLLDPAGHLDELNAPFDQLDRRHGIVMFVNDHSRALRR